MDEVEAFLEHYGVRGMRWGVRKSATVQEAKKDAKTLRKAERDRSPGYTKRRREVRESVTAKKLASEEYATELNKQSIKLSRKALRRDIAKVGVAVAINYAALNPEAAAKAGRFVSSSAKTGTIKLATAAGKATRRLGESQVERFLRKNAYTPATGAKVTDVYSRVAGETLRIAGALTR